MDGTRLQEVSKHKQVRSKGSRCTWASVCVGVWSSRPISCSSGRCIRVTQPTHPRLCPTDIYKHTQRINTWSDRTSEIASYSQVREVTAKPLYFIHIDSTSTNTCKVWLFIMRPAQGEVISLKQNSRAAFPVKGVLVKLVVPVLLILQKNR